MTTNKTRFLIVGGVAGGATAAARIRRLTEDAEIVLFEKGKYISCLLYTSPSPRDRG